MATFNITAPDGKTYKVTGQTAEGALAALKKHLGGGGSQVVATTPDGKVTRLSDGSLSFSSPGYSTNDQEAVKRLMEGEGVKEVVQSGFDQQTISQHPIAARVNEFNRGAPFIGSYLDEAVGVVSPDAAKAMRQTSDAMQRENPVETAALNLGGAAAYTLPMLAMTPQRVVDSAAKALPASKFGRSVVGVLGGSGAAATEGGIYGYGEGETLDERRDSAATHAKMGGLFGGFLGGASPFIADGVGALIKRWKSRDISAISREFGVSDDTAKVLKKAFQANDEGAITRILKAGDEATLADAGRSGQALLDAAAQTGGQPLNIVDTAVTGRANRSLGILNDALDSSLGPVQGPRAAARSVAEQSAPARKAAYGAAYDTPIDYGTGGAGEQILETLSRMDAKTVQDAAGIANRKMKWDGIGGKQILLDVAEDGSWSFKGELPNVRQLDELKKALNQVDQNARDTFGRSTDGGLTGQQARAVRDATVQATGGDGGTYAKALKIGGDKVEMDRALEFGLDMLRDTNKSTKEIVGETLSGMSADGRKMMKIGLRSHIDEALGKVKMIASDPDGMEARQAMAALKMLTSDNAKAKLKLLLGPDEFNKVMPQIDKAVSSQAMKASVARNSATAIRQSIQGEVADVTKPGLLGQLARGEPVDATKRLTQELLATTPGDDAARMEQIWTEVAEVLSKQRGNKSATAALNYVNKAIAGQPLKDAEAQLIARQVVLGLPALSDQLGQLVLSTP